jgi:iron complex transport system substrate-binding protein
VKKKGKMKTKNKVLTLLEIVIVLCSVFFLALPAIAAEQTTQTITTTSEDKYVLGVYGNANEDDTIDMRDLTYVKLMFFGKKPETGLADAKYDGKINPLDFIQIKLIIVGKEKELTIVDDRGRIKVFKLPMKRIICIDDDEGEPIRVLGAEDLVVGVGTSLVTHDIILPEMSKLPTVGSTWGGIDYEKLLSLRTALFLAPSLSGQAPKIEEELEPYGVQVFLAMFNIPTEVVENIKKLGYLIGKVDKAEEFADFHEEVINKIKARVEGLPEDKKPRVYMEQCFGKYKTSSKGWKHDDICTMAGGINIAHDLAGDMYWAFNVDPEWVVEQNPDIIIKEVSSKCGFGVEDATEMKAAREEIMNRPELANVNAVKKGNVYVVSSDIARSGLQGFVMAAYMAKWFHPDIFKDLDPESIQQGYVDRFLRVDYDVKKGTFVYPSLED